MSDSDIFDQLGTSPVGGPPGKDGKDGKDGQNGQNGANPSTTFITLHPSAGSVYHNFFGSALYLLCQTTATADGASWTFTIGQNNPPDTEIFDQEGIPNGVKNTALLIVPSGWWFTWAGTNITFGPCPTLM